MEELYEMTDRGTKEFFPARKQHLANRPSREKLAYILTAKRCFPQKADPELLTWTERLMIRHLNKTDPVTWSAERLAEAFPATERAVKKVIKNRYRVDFGSFEISNFFSSAQLNCKDLLDLVAL